MDHISLEIHLMTNNHRLLSLLNFNSHILYELFLTQNDKLHLLALKIKLTVFIFQDSCLCILLTSYRLCLLLLESRSTYLPLGQYYIYINGLFLFQLVLVVLTILKKFCLIYKFFLPLKGYNQLLLLDFFILFVYFQKVKLNFGEDFFNLIPAVLCDCVIRYYKIEDFILFITIVSNLLIVVA